MVEDTEAVAQRFEECLREGPVEAALRHAESLEAGLEALREGRPDALVVDLELSESSGPEATRAFAAAAPEVPIVALVESGKLQAALTAQRAGATEHLQKGDLSPALVGRTLRWAAERSRMQAKLRQRDAWIRSITERISAGVFRAGPTGRIEYANEALAEMLGFESEEELVGRDLTTFYADPTQRGRVMVEEEANDVEVELRAEDGSTVVVLLSARAAYDARGRPVHYDGVVSDITARKKRERKLRMLFEAVGQAKEAVIVTEAEPLDEPGPRVVYANEAFEEQAGWTEEEILGKTPRVLQGPETDRETLDSLREALEAGEEWEGETVNYRKDGTPYRVQWNVSPVRGEGGEIEHWVSVQRDVTEKRKQEEKLRRQKHLLEQTQRLAGAWEVDLQAGEMSWSDKVYEIHEVEPEAEVSVEEGIGFYAPEARPEVREAFERCAEEGEPYDLEVPLVTAKGNRRWVRTVGGPAETDDGEVVTVAGAFQDITERKTEERRRRKVIRRVTDAIVEVDSEWRFALVNEQAERLYEMSEEELLGEDFWEVFSGALGTRFEEEYRGVMETREPTRFEEYYPGLDGWFDIQVYPNEDGGLAFYFEEITERKEREEALRRKERRYRAVFEDPNILVGLIGLDGRVLDINQTALRYIGESLEEVKGKLFWETPWFEGDKTLQNKIRTWLRQAVEGEYVEFEADLSEAVGEPFLVSGAIRPVTDEEGEVTSLLITDRDVTERRLGQRRLERYREYTDHLLNSSEDLFFVVDTSGRLERWNEQVAQVTGYSEEEISEMSVLDFFPETERARAQEALEEVFATGSSKLETNLLTRGGEEVPYEFTGNRAEHPDGDLRLVGIGRDVSEQKRREQALRDRREKAEALYEGTRRLLAAESPRAVSHHVHEVVEEVFDYDLSNTALVEEGLIEPVDVATSDSVDVPPPEARPWGGQSIAARALRERGTALVEDTRALDNEVDYGDLRSVAVVPIGERGVIVLGRAEKGPFDPFDLRLIEVLAGYGGAVLKRLENERELVRAKDQAEEAARLKTALLANMSHEIRTPLTTIIGFAEVLKGELEGRAEDLIERIRQGGQRLMRTLDSILQLSRLEAGAYSLKREKVDLSQLIEETAELLSPRAEEEAVSLRTSVPSGPVEGEWNEGALNRILENLLENALKFTPEGGRVEVRAWTEDGKAAFEVEDTGVGISEEALPEIFEAFRQESEGLSREYEGSGLGLSITRRLVEVHGGTIEVESQKGEGSRFTVRLPKRPPEEGG